MQEKAQLFKENLTKQKVTEKEREENTKLKKALINYEEQLEEMEQEKALMEREIERMSMVKKESMVSDLWKLISP